MSESFAVEGIILAVIILVILAFAMLAFAMLAGIYLIYSPIGFSGPGGPVYYCTVSNESAVTAAYLDGYRDGLSRCGMNDIPGWSWNYTEPNGVKKDDI